MSPDNHHLPSDLFSNPEVNADEADQDSRSKTDIRIIKIPVTNKSLLAKILIPVFFVIIVIGGLIGYWEITDKFVPVHRGNLYRSAEIHSNKLLKLSQKHGFRTVIDLRVEKDKAQIEKGVLKTIGVKHVHIPSGQIPTQEAVETFIKIMDDLQNRPVLIHCIHGVGRTGIFSAIYRIEYQEWSHSKALLEAMLLAGFGSFLPNSDKAMFITSYNPRH